MNFHWALFLDLGTISAGLLVATLIRAKVRFFQRYLIPNALTAGFILLPLYNFVFPRLGLNAGGLGELVYHLLSISFVAMTLRRSGPAGTWGDKRIYSTSVGILSQYAIQALLGLAVTYVLMRTLMPSLFPSFGFLLPLGYALGPGQAYAIGQGWEAFGFRGGGTIGLTFAALGFLWACFGGIFLVNFGIRKGWLEKEYADRLARKGIRRGVYAPGENLPAGSYLTTETEAIDSMTFNTAIVLVVYLCAYLLLSLITYLLTFAGKLGHDLAVNLWAISFIFAALVGLVAKTLLKKLRVEHTVDNQTLTRLAGLSVDLMVAASIAAISLVVVTEYWLPILILALLGGVLTLVTVPWISSRMFRDHKFHRTLIIFGASTGTLPTGLALLRSIDPDFETPVASDYMYATGLTFVLAIPFILSINLPAYSATTGNMNYFLYAVLVSVGYLIFSVLSFLFISRSRAFKAANHVWMHEPHDGR
ncbi:MAG TPA: sodium:glutamate symporter [Spirochaetia bacterium]|nr:sodium:glutamate symporter [Spirochaetia bacterium]